MGFQAAIAVSVIGLKMIVSSRGSTAMPRPWEDLRPTRFTGKSVPSAGGPDASTAVDTLNILETKIINSLSIVYFNYKLMNIINKLS